MDCISYHRNQEGAPLWHDNEFCFSLFLSSKTLEHSGSGHSYSSNPSLALDDRQEGSHDITKKGHGPVDHKHSMEGVDSTYRIKLNFKSQVLILILKNLC